MTGQSLATSAVPLDGDLVLTHDEHGAVAWLLSRHPGEAAVGSPARDWTLQLGSDLAREWAVDLWICDGEHFRRIETFRGLPCAPPPVPSRNQPAAEGRRRSS
jgi:hypothetical protein